eukprot:6205855-Pleurochrysis_carterae.AAC.2
MPVHCYHKPGSSEHARLAGIVSSGIAIKPDVIWKAGQAFPRFRIDVVSLRSRPGKVAVQKHRLLCDTHADMSLHYSLRVANPSDKTVKRLRALLTQKGGSKGFVSARAGGMVMAPKLDRLTSV